MLLIMSPIIETDSQGRIIITENPLSKKILEKSEIDSTFLCHLCGQQLTNSRRFKTHLLSHSDLKPFACPICKASFKFNSHLTRHSFVHKDYAFQCDFCEKKYKTKYLLYEHKKSHSNNHAFNCDLCNKGFIRKYDYEVHMDLKHAEKKRFVCPICNRALASKSSLEYHTKTHDWNFKETVSDYKCEQCNKYYYNKRALKLHTQKRHIKIPEYYVCDVCGKDFRSQTGFTAHKLSHDGIKPHKCNLCGKKFLRISALHTHERIHTGEKPFKCNICGKSFNQHSPLNRHMKMHAGDRSVSCQLCDLKFFTKSCLNTHMKNKHKVV